MSEAAAAAAGGGTAVVNKEPGPVNGEAGKFTVPKEIMDWGKGKIGDSFEKLANDNPDFYKFATSYRDTEKLLGGEKLPLPKDPNDAAAWDQVFDKLGRPKTAAEYKIPMKEGEDPTMVNWAKGVFHQAGLTQKQAERVGTEWNGFVEKIIAETDRQTGERAAADLAGLQKDWGNDFEGNKVVATKAWNTLASELGISRDKLDALQEVFGVRDAMRLFEKIGTKLGAREDTFETGGNRGGNATVSKEQAQKTKDQLLADPEFAARYKQKDHSAVQRLQELNAIISGQ
jgi:hypothetical protein